MNTSIMIHIGLGLICITNLSHIVHLCTWIIVDQMGVEQVAIKPCNFVKYEIFCTRKRGRFQKINANRHMYI